jgi:hypothetical protein
MLSAAMSQLVLHSAVKDRLWSEKTQSLLLHQQGLTVEIQLIDL